MPLAKSDNPAPAASMAMKKLAAVVYRQNAAMNLAKREHDSARKELLAAMKEAKLSQFRTTTTIGDAKITLEARVETPEVTFIDVAKLRPLVTEEVFLQVVSATKEALKNAGAAVWIPVCEATREGTENVKVGVAK